MKKLLSSLFFFSSLIASSQNIPPEINNLTLEPNGDQSITISYNLLDNEDDACMVTLQVIDENNVSFLVQNNVVGDLNVMVSTGNNKSFTWNYNNDLNTSGNYTFKLVADDLIDINIQEIVDQVDSTLLYNDLAFIQGIRHRNAGLDHLNEVRDYITDRMNTSGFTPETQEFIYSNFTGENYIANSYGTENQNEIYILCGHYDSVDDSPGADDNGSAIAGLLEAIRLLSPYNFKRTIKYIAFDLEEPGLKGSNDYVSNGVPNADVIAGVIDFEMIGYATEEPNTQSFPFGFNSLFPVPYAEVEADEFRGNFIANVAKVNQNDWELAFENAANTYVPELKVVTIIAPDNWETITPDLGRSDHAPFWNEGYPAVMLTGTANFRNENYHTPNDTLETLNFTFMANVVKATIATLAEEGEIQHSGYAVESIDLNVSWVNDTELNTFQLYPNPTSEFLFLESSQKILSISIYDTNGKIVLIENNPKNNINISHLSRGTYNAQLLVIGNKKISSNFVIQ